MRVEKSGYGRARRIGDRRNSTVAHIVIWEEHRGPVPKGMHLDHLCRNRRCVNPEHLEPVTPRENIHRSRVVKFSDAVIAEVRASPLSAKEAAQAFGMNEFYVYEIRRGAARPGR